MKKSKFLKIFLMVTFICVIMTSAFVLADVGNFNSYDGGSSSSSWSSSSSNWSSSSYDYDYGSSSGGGSLEGIVGILIVVIIIIVISVINKKKVNISSVSSYIPTTNNTKQVADMIRQNDPNFSEEEFLMWTKDLFVKLQTAWTARDFEAIRTFETTDLFEQHSTQLKEYIKNNKINVVERVSVNYAALTDYQTDGAKETITLRLNAKMKDYIINDKTQELLEGNKEKYWEMSYRLKFVRKSGRKTVNNKSDLKATNCPNCGAPTEITSSGKCEYCGAIIVTDDHDWVLSSLESIR